MKKLLLALVVVSFLGGVAAAQRTEIKKLDVSTRTVSRNTTRRPYLIDVTRTDAVFTVAAGVDRSRIKVHTSKGDMTLTELLRKAGRPTTGSVRIGLTSVIQTGGLTHFPAGTTQLVNCEGFLCTCTGDEDCNDMFLNHGCGDIAGCDERGCWCLRL
jgi:hypothetical protein